MEELNRLMSTLQAELSGTQLEELTSTINFINSTITNVQKAVVVPLAKGLEMATGFVEQLKSAIAEINGTIEVSCSLPAPCYATSAHNLSKIDDPPRP